LFGILSASRDLALRRAMLPERRTGAALRDMQMLSDKLDAGATTRGVDVSLGGLRQDQFVERQIGHRLAQPTVLKLKILKPFHLLDFQATELLSQSIEK
jgi:hypothetical protein